MRTVSPEDRYVAWARFNTHDGRSATTLHLCDSDAPGAFRVYRWEDVQDGAAREIKRLTAALERIRTGIAHDRCDGDSEFAAGVSAACRNHLELVNAAVADGVMEKRNAEWQPIATAPKDSSWVVLGYFPSDEGFEQSGGLSSSKVMFWHLSRRLWCNGREFWNSTGFYSPTHWLRLEDAFPADPRKPAPGVATDQPNRENENG